MSIEPIQRTGAGDRYAHAWLQHQATGGYVERAVAPRWTPTAVRLGLRLAGQFALLVLLFHAGTAAAEATGVPLPGNLVGMLLLLGLLRLGVVRPGHVQDLAGLALQHLNFFFIPLAVGLMTWTGLLAASGVALGLSLLGSAVVGLAVAGRVGQRLSRWGGAYDVR
jgi:holin-like protein